MRWNIYNTSNFFETSIGISNMLHELEINSYFNFENCCFEMEILYFNFEFLKFESSYLNFENYYFDLEN